MRGGQPVAGNRTHRLAPRFAEVLTESDLSSHLDKQRRVADAPGLKRIRVVLRFRLGFGNAFRSAGRRRSGLRGLRSVGNGSLLGLRLAGVRAVFRTFDGTKRAVALEQAAIVDHRVVHAVDDAADVDALLRALPGN